ncbi:MAG: acetyltransferase [Oceanospirillaceae bacterium]|nr:acetyltransferase [Oceanospirillaceae bacterium]
MEQQKIPLVLFGNGAWAEFIAYILDHDSSFEVVAFTVDADYLTTDTFSGRPVVPFETVERAFSPSDYMMMNCAGFVAGNRLRARRYADGKDKGYRFGSYVSSKASVWPDLQLGENSFVHEHAVVQPFARIGENTQVLSQAIISHHTVVGDHGFVASSAVVGGRCTVKDYCFLGMNSTVKHELTIADHVTLGAGATLVADAKKAGVYVGTPAKWLKG